MGASLETKLEERTSPWWGLAAIWLVVVFFSLYGAVEVRDAMAKSELLADLPALQGAMVRVAKLGDALGMERLRNAVEDVRAVVNKPYLILEELQEIPPEVAPPVTPPPPPSDLVADERPHEAAPWKRRVLVIGASSIQFAVGVEFERRLPTYEGVKVKRFGKLATGLARPDFFDWPKKLDQLARRFKPDLVIANFGGNGAQDIPTAGYRKIKFATEEWDRMYRERVKEMIDIARRRGADIVFIGMPNMRESKFAKKMRHINKIQRAIAEEEGALWISTWEMASTGQGRYRKSIEYAGKRGLMRTTDGVHYRRLGARFVVDNVLQAIERRYVLSPADEKLARAEGHAFESAQLERPVSYVAFVPKGASGDARRPALYLLPGEESRWGEWPNYPHRELQRLAEAHRLVVVVLDLKSAPSGELFTEEIVKDVEAHLPVTDRRGLAGVHVDRLHEALERIGLAHSYRAADAEAFRHSLRELVAWHARQLESGTEPPDGL